MTTDYEAGRRAGLEDAAREADEWAKCPVEDDADEGVAYAGRRIALAIRALAAPVEARPDPADPEHRIAEIVLEVYPDMSCEEAEERAQWALAAAPAAVFDAAERVRQMLRDGAACGCVGAHEASCPLGG